MNRTSNIDTKLHISGLNSQDYSFASSILSAHYQYDALYRLIQATGRELTSLAMPSHEDFPNNIPCPNTDPNALQNYTQKYEYDELGNIMQMKSDHWTRNYVYQIGKNYLLKHDEEQSLPNYTYDAHGNMLSMPHLSSMEWDEKDQLHSATNGTLTSYYNYDAQGNRTRKVVEKAGGITETRYCIGGYEVFRKENSTADFERTTLNISDDEKTFVRIETKTGESPVIRYQYDNHLGSACLELDDTGDIISYEEYHPFGTTSYRSGRTEIEVSLKRYKYCGKERDEETGLYYYGMRYYAAWLCRFVSVDPLQFKYPHYTPYQYAGNKPITFIDLDGGEEKKTTNESPKEFEIQPIRIRVAQSFPEPDPTGGLGSALTQSKQLSIMFSNQETLNPIQTNTANATNAKDTLSPPNATNAMQITDSTFFQFLPKLQEFEGGFVNNKNDRGGATNKGITLKTFTLYSKELFGLEPSIENLKALTNEQASIIYETKYWNPSKAGNIIDKQLSYQYFDTYVNGGGTNVLRTTIEQYGEVYDKSLSKNIETLNRMITKQGGESVFNSFKENRIKRFERIVEKDSSQKVFLNGWKNRANKFNYKKD